MDNFIKKLTEKAEVSSKIDDSLYKKFNVKRGLRNEDSTGVLVGLTHVGDVIGYKKEEDKVIPVPGRLVYSGYDIEDIIKNLKKNNINAFEEVTFLLLFGDLPSEQELAQFCKMLSKLHSLPENFTEDMILKLKGKDIMNMLARCVLALYTFDKKADDTSTENIMLQSLELIAKFPAIIVYSYHSMRHHYYKEHLIIRHPKAKLSLAENFLYMLKGKFTQLESSVLDLCLVLHAEHGGGNNSTFTMHVVSSSGTDTYSAVASSLASLKGPLHGGANLQVMDMMDDIKNNVKDWKDEKLLKAYLMKILNKEAYDKSGKIYGFGHAVYTISDPRAILLKTKAKELAIEKDRSEELDLYLLVEKIVPDLFLEFKGSKKRISANVDFFSGFVYDCLDIPKEVYTPLFAMARISGWCAHRLEELISSRRIIRPAYKNVAPEKEYKKLKNE